MSRSLFTSESVTEGHPDKVADAIADGVLDAVLAQDPQSRVACETFVTTGLVLVGGEITTSAEVDVPAVARGVIRRVGYTDSRLGFDAETCSVVSVIQKQSQDISRGVDTGGAGDQGMMFGYACRETPTLMPLPVDLAHRLVRRMAQIRKRKVLKYLRPDGKSQVTVEYRGGKPLWVHSVLLSTQHDPDVAQARIKRDLWRHVVQPVIPLRLRSQKLRFLCNPTGRFVKGGPHGDTGLSGRKIIVDTYGGMGRHGGGSFSGKDPSKVDRSASYAARWVAKNIVAARLADRVEVRLSYAIGKVEPTSVDLESFGTGRVPEDDIRRAIRKVFDLTPRGIVRDLKLRRPIYSQTSVYGHFGRTGPGFTWEKTNRVAALKKILGR